MMLILAALNAAICGWNAYLLASTVDPIAQAISLVAVVISASATVWCLAKAAEYR